MTFLPIVDRELRVAARRRGTYWSRLAVALVGLIIGGWIMLIPGFQAQRYLGIALFTSLAVFAFIYAGFAGVFATADALSEEKREGTLGLLFLTDLKGYDIVFGKLTAKSLNTFYGLLALFPVMAIPLMAGGVTGAEFWRVVLVCVNTLFFSMALGMFCSAISRDERKAMVLAVLALLFFAAGLPILVAILENWVRDQGALMFLFVPSPGYAGFMAFEATFNGGFKWNLFYASVSFLHGLSWLLLMTSARLVQRGWQDKETRKERGKMWRRWTQRLGWTEQQRARRRGWQLAFNPFYWLAGRNGLKSMLVWGVLGAGGFIWALGILFNRRDWLDPAAYGLTAYLAHTIFKFWITYEACRRLSSDRRSGALELLLVTPISVQTILRGQLLALGKQFGGPVAVVLVADFLFGLGNFRDRDWLLFMGSITVVFVADLVALSWVGMWQALRSRSVNRAVGATAVRILVLPWVLYCLVLTTVALGGFVRSFAPYQDFIDLAIASGPMIALLVDVVFCVSAYLRLRQGFRRAVSERRLRRWFGRK